MTKPFKSQRAAQVAMTKAEKAYTAAMCAASTAYPDALAARCAGTSEVDPIDAMRAAHDARSAAFEHGAAVYAQAKAQGFWVRSWHFSDCNPTRDLIRDNRD